MPIQTEHEYYSDKRNWGGYQHTSLKDIINEMLIESTDSDNYLANTRRSTMLLHAKDTIRELSKDIKNDVLAIERTVGEQPSFPLPQDYVDWVRVSVVGVDFKLLPLRVNNSIPTAIGYLQDHRYDLLFDNNGGILKANSINTYNHPYKKYTVGACNGQNNNGEFKIDKRMIAFSSDLSKKEVVIEYISDGLQMHNLREEEITVHKNLLDVVKESIYFKCISKRRNVPRNEKDRSRGLLLKLKHRAKLDLMKFDMKDFGRVVELRNNRY